MSSYFRTIDSFLTTLNESVVNDRLELYTSSKDSNLYEILFKRELRFGNNAGLNYGAGTYTILYPPSEAEVGYSEDVRGKLYGDYLYKFSMSTANVLFLVWEEYEKTRRCSELKSTRDNYIEHQFKAIGVPIPPPDVLAQIKPPTDVKPTKDGRVPLARKYPATMAQALFRYMNQIAYLNSDGTIDSPIEAFVYYGRNDGFVGVVWRPYTLKPEGISEDGGKSWQKLNTKDQAYKEYVSSLSNEYKPQTEANKLRIFRAGHDGRSEQAYRAMTSYSDDTGRVFLGSFTDIVINKDTIDATYKSNLPQLDEFKHYYRPVDCESMRTLHKLGYRLGKLDCGIKYGTQSGEQQTMDDIRSIPEYLLPDEVTGGVKLVNIEVTDWDLPAVGSSDELVLKKCSMTTDDEPEGWDVTILDSSLRENVREAPNDQSLTNRWIKIGNALNRIKDVKLRRDAKVCLGNLKIDDDATGDKRVSEVDHNIEVARARDEGINSKASRQGFTDEGGYFIKSSQIRAMLRTPNAMDALKPLFDQKLVYISSGGRKGGSGGDRAENLMADIISASPKLKAKVYELAGLSMPKKVDVVSTGKLSRKFNVKGTQTGRYQTQAAFKNADMIFGSPSEIEAIKKLMLDETADWTIDLGKKSTLVPVSAKQDLTHGNGRVLGTGGIGEAATKFGIKSRNKKQNTLDIFKKAENPKTRTDVAKHYLDDEATEPEIYAYFDKAGVEFLTSAPFKVVDAQYIPQQSRTHSPSRKLQFTLKSLKPGSKSSNEPITYNIRTVNNSTGPKGPECPPDRVIGDPNKLDVIKQLSESKLFNDVLRSNEE